MSAPSPNEVTGQINTRNIYQTSSLRAISPKRVRNIELKRICGGEIILPQSKGNGMLVNYPRGAKVF